MVGIPLMNRWVRMYPVSILFAIVFVPALGSFHIIFVVRLGLLTPVSFRSASCLAPLRGLQTST